MRISPLEETGYALPVKYVVYRGRCGRTCPLFVYVHWTHLLSFLG